MELSSSPKRFKGRAQVPGHQSLPGPGGTERQNTSTVPCLGTRLPPPPCWVSPESHRGAARGGCTAAQGARGRRRGRSWRKAGAAGGGGMRCDSGSAPGGTQKHSPGGGEQLCTDVNGGADGVPGTGSRAGEGAAQEHSWLLVLLRNPKQVQIPEGSVCCCGQGPAPLRAGLPGTRSSMGSPRGSTVPGPQSPQGGGPQGTATPGGRR